MAERMAARSPAPARLWLLCCACLGAWSCGGIGELADGGGSGGDNGGTASGGAVGTGGATASGGTTGSSGGSLGSTGSGGTPAGSGGTPASSGGALGAGGLTSTGGAGPAGGRSGSGGATAGNGGRSGPGGMAAPGGAMASGGRGGTGAGGRGGTAVGSGGATGAGGMSACPMVGHVTYKLTKSSAPTADETAAYARITAAMDMAVTYYNCYTSITKADTVTYVPSVQTADGSTNGSIRFGSTDSMNYITAMHEISHTVGIGSSQFGALVVNGIFTGTNATDQLRAITGNPQDQVHGDTQHFWPNGLNYTTEVKSVPSDLINHCLMVTAIRKDMGM